VALAQIFTPMYFTVARKPLPKAGAPARSALSPTTSAATRATADDEADDA
jgi:hypothetical protein